MIANVIQCVTWVKSKITPGEDIVVVALPLYHIFSLTVCCFSFMMSGSHCLLVTNPRHMKSFIKTMIKTPFTIFIGLNTLFTGILNHARSKEIDFSKVCLTISGGMALQSAVAKRWHERTGRPIIQGYGLTEASPVVTINPVFEKEFNGSIGLPISSTDVMICDDNGKSLGPGEVGELCVKGPQVMEGYWRQPEETANVLSQDGWLKTGDMARIDDQGYVYIVDRKKDMILVSGFNVYPNEIEEVISLMPEVLEVCVVGVPSEKTGEAIKAFIVKRDESLTDEAIVNFCKERLTKYKVPKQIEFRESLPKSNVGKILRRELVASRTH